MPLLQQDPPLRVTQEHRERPMQQAAAVGGMLLGVTERAIVLVDQNDLVRFAR
jgi:hypothetical protein